MYKFEKSYQSLKEIASGYKTFIYHSLANLNIYIYILLQNVYVLNNKFLMRKVKTQSFTIENTVTNYINLLN